MRANTARYLHTLAGGPVADVPDDVD